MFALRITFRSLAAALAIGLAVAPARAADDALAQTPEDKQLLKEATQKSPSFQQKKWTGTQGSYESYLEYNYVGATSQNLGNGRNRDIDENYIDFRHEVMRHTLLAFLAQGGFEYQHTGF